MGALAHLTQVIGKLLDDPGMFEACQKELNAVYIEFAQNRFVISNSIEILFTQSIDEPNFRYMGARVCRLLDGIVATPDSIFRELLSFKMQDTQHQNKVFIKNEANKVRGSALFLGELFLQLQNVSGLVVRGCLVPIQMLFFFFWRGGPSRMARVSQRLRRTSTRRWKSCCRS